MLKVGRGKKTKNQQRILQGIVSIIGRQPSFYWTTREGRPAVRFGPRRVLDKEDKGIKLGSRYEDVQVGVACDYAEEHGCTIITGKRARGETTLRIILPAD